MAAKAVGALGAVPAARGARRGEEKQPGDGASRQLAKSGAEVIPAIDVTAILQNPRGGVVGADGPDGDSGFDPPPQPARNRMDASAAVRRFISIHHRLPRSGHAEDSTASMSWRDERPNAVAIRASVLAWECKHLRAYRRTRAMTKRTCLPWRAKCPRHVDHPCR